MSNVFECPRCGAPLDYAGGPDLTISCPYCNASVIVPETLRQPGSAAVAGPPATLVSGAGLFQGEQLEQLRQMRTLARLGRQTEAAQIYRSLFGGSLGEASQAVSQLAAGKPVMLVQSAGGAVPASSAELAQAEARQASAHAALEAELRQLLQRGLKVEAVKRYHTQYKCGLKAAKDAVEALERGDALPYPAGQAPLLPESPLTTAAGELQRTIQQAMALAQITQLAQQGQKIEAIKLYRQTFDAGLKASQEAVERLARGESVDTTITVQAGSAYQPVVTTTTMKKAGAAAGAAGCLGVGMLVGVILLFTIVPLLIALAQPGGPLFSLWARLNPAAPARLVLEFGAKGSGVGLFDDPRAIAVDRGGNIYVAEYDDGRVQVFDPAGQALALWMTQKDPYVGGMAVDATGQVLIVYRGKVWRFADLNGEALGALTFTQDLYFNAISATPDGTLLAVANNEDLVRFRLRSNGIDTVIFQDVLSAGAGESGSIRGAAADGLGNMYALVSGEEDAVFKYSQQGRYLSRFGSSGDGEGQFRAPDAIAVDGYGRVFVSDIHGVQVFDANGRYLDRFEVDGVAFGLTFDATNHLYAVTNRPKVIKLALEAPQE
jgi:ribosomal protein L7/L12